MTRDEQILSLAKQVESHANKIKRRVPKNVSLAELMNAGWLGAIESVDRFDGRANATLAGFADRRISGAMLDHLRESDAVSHVRRGLLKRIDKFRVTFEAKNQSAPSEQEISEHCGVPIKNLQAICNIPRHMCISEAVSIQDTCALDEFQHRRDHIDMEANLRKAGLSVRQREYVRLKFWDDLSVSEIASRYGCHSSLVSLGINLALQKIRAQHLGLHKGKYPRKYMSIKKAVRSSRTSDSLK